MIAVRPGEFWSHSCLLVKKKQEEIFLETFFMTDSEAPSGVILGQYLEGSTAYERNTLVNFENRCAGITLRAVGLETIIQGIIQQCSQINGTKHHSKWTRRREMKAAARLFGHKGEKEMRMWCSWSVFQKKITGFDRLRNEPILACFLLDGPERRLDNQTHHTTRVHMVKLFPRVEDLGLASSAYP